MRTLVIAALMLSLSIGSAHAAEPHVHGVAFLNVGVDGQRVDLSMNGAGDNFTGFERAPANAEEIRLLNASSDALTQGERLFAFSPGATCRQQSSSVQPPLFAKGEGHDDHDDHDEDEHDDDGHAHSHSANWSVQWRFQCSAPAELKELRANLFDAFPRLLELRVQLVSDEFQTGASLTPKSRLLKMTATP